MRFRDYVLNEERLDNSDKRTLAKLIQNPKNTTIVISSFANHYDESEREVDVRKTTNGVTFTFNADHYELVNTLVDLSDAMGYTFQTDTERNINITTFTVIK